MAVMDEDTGRMLNYKQLMRDPKYKKHWSTSSANEFGRLANGVDGRIKNPTNTIKFIIKKDIPSSRRKDVKNRTRFFIGGYLINYPGEVATPTA